MQYPSNTTSAGTLRTLPYRERHQPIQFEDEGGRVGEQGYPINYNEVYNLKGRLLTLIDATFTDPEQRKAQKDIVWSVLREWMDDIIRAGDQQPARMDERSAA